MHAPSLTELRRGDPQFKAAVKRVRDKLHNAAFADLIEQLCDTRPIHKELFLRFQTNETADAAGNYRGTVGTSIEKWNIGGDPEHPADTTSAYQDVKLHMDDLSAIISQMKISESPRKYFKKAVFIFQRFQVIHPYYDGNGHIDRFIISNLMARHPMISTSEEFSIYPHPFSTALRICVNSYRSNPEILESYFLNWFRY